MLGRASLDADGVHQSRGGAHRQQTVRVRHDSLITTYPEGALLPSGHAHEHHMPAVGLRP